MLKDRAFDYFVSRDMNCAEASLSCINEVYSLGLGPEDIKLVSCFGGGMGCGKTCGVLCGCLSALGKMRVKERAHVTEGFRDECAGFYESFEKKLGDSQCEVLKPKYWDDDVRCLKTVELGLEAFEEYIRELK